MSEKTSEKKHTRVGFTVIVGRPNVGKSTLLNHIVGEKISIVSPVPQTTRTMVRGVYTDDRGQVVFLDTPGWHLGRDRLDRYMNKTSMNSLDDADAIIHLADTSKPIGEEEYHVVEKLRNIKTPIILGLNKIDLKGEYVAQYISLWEEARKARVADMKDFVLMPLSGKEGTQVDRLIDVLFSFFREGELYYEPDVVTDTPQRQVVADIVREKLFLLMREEVPHSIAVLVDEMRPAKGKTTFIRATIMVERDSQKEIIIGARGQMLKKVGTLAREELETLLETKVFIDLYARVKKNWRDDGHLLIDMGYTFE